MHDSHSEKKDRLGYGPDTSVVTNEVRISFVKLNSILDVAQPTLLLTSPLYDVLDHTNHIFTVRI